jgi:hypothetical protein
MSQRACNIVASAWSAITNGDEATGDQLVAANRSKDNVLDNFICTRGNNLNGRVSRQEFEKYYSEVFTAVPSDEYFVRQVESTWGV